MLNEHISEEVRRFLTGFLERMLEEEFSLYIGRDRYQRRKAKDIRIYRNGYRIRYYLTIWSQLLKLRVPRSRNSNFKPLLFRKGGITSEPLEQMMIQIEMIDYQLCQQEDSTNYIRLLDRLKRRGLTEDKFRLVVHDGHAAITKAVRTVYNKEKVIQQECLIHHMRNVINKIENRTNKDQLRNDLWKVYSAVTEKEFLKLHKQTIRKWYDLEKEAMQQFGKLNSRMFTKYQFSIEIHKDIHSNNPIERYFREIRRRTKAIGIFESLDSADRLLFLTIENINQRRGSIPTNSNLVFTH